MEVVIVATPADAATVVADVVARVVATVASPVLGLATGSSPLAAYGELVARCRRGEISFATADAVLLDEYLGLSAGHPQAYRAFIRRELTDHVDLDPARLHGPDVACADVPALCARYEALLADLGGVDVQLLGIGSDGHIGFNEPGSSLGSRTRIKTLTAGTRRDNARFFGSLDEVPHHVVTQGLATIGAARHALLVATGSAKAEPVARAVEGPLTAMCPASVLQLHPHATVVVDEAAAARLVHAAYYRDVSAGKPPWQAL
jgi:glucosamine-6-phosphate deaminase